MSATKHERDETLSLLALKESLRRFLFGEARANPLNGRSPLRLLVVDDEPFVGDALKMMFAFDGMVADAVMSGSEAISLFETGKYDVVITDFAMPRMKGDELATAIKKLCPTQPIMMITAYAEYLEKSGNPLANVDFLLSKPFLLENLRDGIAHVLSRTANERAIYQEPFYQSGAHLVLNSCETALSQILASMRDQRDVAETMVRHKAKNLVLDYLESIKPGMVGLSPATEKLRDQLRSLMRFSVRIRLTREMAFAEYVEEVLGDLRKEHAGIQVDSELGARLKAISLPDGHVALLCLVICELIDNAVEALNGKGRVSVVVDVLGSKQSLLIKVRDTGPGVPLLAGKMRLGAVCSTRGAGRGLGLQLVEEAILKLGGQIHYTFEGGAVFKVIVPIAQAPHYLPAFLRNLVTPTKSSRVTLEQKAISVAFSYSHKDEELRDHLETHLKLLQRQGYIDTWHDRKIAPGQSWEGVIDESFRKANLVLALVSADFLASDYCQGVEMAGALERQSKGEAILIPIILRACDWHTAPFAKFQALPKNGKPVTSWKNMDEAWSDVANGIRKLLGELRNGGS